MYLLIPLILILLLPEISYAWGPATHIKLGIDVLSNSFIPPVIFNLINEFPYYFLYGNIEADVILWKNKIEYSKHCHNWKIGFEILKTANTPELKAFAYGYLSHLSADIIAHNFFIPIEMLLNYPYKKGKHLPWEIRYDRWIDGEAWEVLKKIKKEIDPSCDELLKNMLERKFFSFKTNKRIFTTFLTLQRLNRWKLLMKNKKISGETRFYYDLSLFAMVSILSKELNSPFVKIDPTGIRVMKKAQRLIRELKGLKDGIREVKRKVLLKKLLAYQPYLPADCQRLLFSAISSRTLYANSSFEHFGM